MKVLNQAWGGKNNVLKLYATIYQRYKEHQLITQHHHNIGELKDEEINTIITECLEPSAKIAP